MRLRINLVSFATMILLFTLLLSSPHVIDSPINCFAIYVMLSLFIFTALQQVNHFIHDITMTNNLYASINDGHNDDLSKFNDQNSTAQYHYEELSTLPTRIQFNESLNKAMAHAKRHNKFLAVLSISLDSFAEIITPLGKSANDILLKEISSRFINTLRTEDIISKLEGEEFIVLLNDIGKPKFASTVAEKLLRACSLPVNVNGQDVSVTASIGICIYPDDGTSLETIFNNVNAALDDVKRAGGNNYKFSTKAIDVEAREYIQLGAALQKAIQNNELSLHFQPRHHLKRGCIAGVESLIRWTHSELGAIDPSVFIPLAEETNLIIPIGEWALFEACKINKYWQDEGYHHFTIGVNLSQKQFNHPDIAKTIAKVLKETGMNPDYLEIEVSESAIMGDIDKASAILNSIKATGVQISVDHFGAGYTSISHLKALPINVLKIDQSFTKGLPNNPNDIAIVNSFIALAHNFGLEVVAEGVETAEQVQYLLTQNCDMVQGYYFSYPLPADKIVQQYKKIMEDVLI